MTSTHPEEFTVIQTFVVEESADFILTDTEANRSARRGRFRSLRREK